MSDCVIRFEGVGKKYSRDNALLAALRGFDGLFGRRRDELRKHEFWALNDVSFEVRHGECMGVIGPNGAGKSTLLRLVNGELRVERGKVSTTGEVTSLIRLGGGLQPLLTGRENIYVKCTERGFTKLETDALLNDIVAFAGLERVLDTPVRQYSDGMYARLEFSIVTCAPMDVLLIDEVLAVGDIAFQMRCLERLEQLKRAGTAILFVSHSEMQVRQIADRCLLLFDGEALALGDPDSLFHKYYEAAGFHDRRLVSLGASPVAPEELVGPVNVNRVGIAGQMHGEPLKAYTGQSLDWVVEYDGIMLGTGVSLLLQFWSASGLLMASFDTARNHSEFNLKNNGRLMIEMPCLGLGSGVYRIAGGFRTKHCWLSYSSDYARLAVADRHLTADHGLMALHGFCRAEERLQ